MKEAHNCGYTALRTYLKKRGLDMQMGYCRKIVGTYLRMKGVGPETIDLLQGSIPKTVFARHYFWPDFDVAKIRKSIESLSEFTQC